MTEALHCPDEDTLRTLLVGRSVVHIEMDPSGPGPDHFSQGPTGRLHLDDGTVLKVWGNDGGCSCNAGCYPLAHITKMDAVIANVKVVERRDEDDATCPEGCGKYTWDGCDHRGFYRVFVFGVDNVEHQLLSFEGSDGNGYYGSGWWLEVMR